MICCKIKYVPDVEIRQFLLGLSAKLCSQSFLPASNSVLTQRPLVADITRSIPVDFSKVNWRFLTFNRDR